MREPGARKLAPDLDETIWWARLVRGGSSNPLRAEIRMTSDVSSGFQSVWAVAERGQVMDAVKAFLDDVMPALSDWTSSIYMASRLRSRLVDQSGVTCWKTA